MFDFFKFTKKKFLYSIVLGLGMTIFSVWGSQVITRTSAVFFVFFGILNLGYLSLQFLLAALLVSQKDLPPSLVYIFIFLPFIGQTLYAYLIISVINYFKNRDKSGQDKQSNSIIDKDQSLSYSIDGMPRHASSFTTGLLSMKILRSPWFVVLSMVLVITLMGTKLLFGDGGFPIVWNPSQDTEILMPNGYSQVVVKFAANQNLSNVAFFLTPSLKEIVSFSPAGFSTITKGNTYQVTLTYRVPNTVNTRYSGTLQLKNKTGNNGTYSMPLPITVVTFDQPIPVDPGDAGKVTLQGIDSDGDGVRDDLQRWIVLNYLDSAKRRAALIQYVKPSQQFLVDASSKDLSLVNDMNEEKSANCADYVFGLNDSIKARKNLRAQLLNTETRSRAYLKADSQLGGTSDIPTYYGQNLKVFCSFDPDLMEN